MYEELVKRLRRCSYSDPNSCEECRNCPNADNFYECKQKLTLQAADAIEELSKENEQFAKMAKVFIDGMNEISEKCADIAGIQAEPPKEETE